MEIWEYYFDTSVIVGFSPLMISRDNVYDIQKLYFTVYLVNIQVKIESEVLDMTDEKGKSKYLVLKNDYQHFRNSVIFLLDKKKKHEER